MQEALIVAHGKLIKALLEQSCSERSAARTQDDDINASGAWILKTAAQMQRA